MSLCQEELHFESNLEPPKFGLGGKALFCKQAKPKPNVKELKVKRSKVLQFKIHFLLQVLL